MSDEQPKDVEVVSSVPALRERSSVLLMPVMDVDTALARLQEFQRFCDAYLKEGIDDDYGVIPGTRKKTLLKPGADKLCEIYGLADEYEIMSQVEDWDRGLFDYKIKCLLRSRRDDSLVSTGVGSCSSYESKYRWRDSQRKCPACSKETIIKGKADFGGGWLCWTKKGGCGAKFKDGDPVIEKQTVGRVENPDIIDTKNTVLKIAKKRAKVDAVIGATRSSGIFTQDMEDAPIPEAAAEVPVSTEPRSYSRPSSPAPASRNGTAQHPQAVAVSEPLRQHLREVTVSEPHVEFIDQGMSANFYRSFRQTLPPGLRDKTDALAKDFLRLNGFVGPDGQGSTERIEKALFAEVREQACAHARSLA